MYDVVTIGSATRDVFVIPGEFEIEEGAKYKTGKAVCFSLGSKIDVPEIYYKTGGSAINAAVTFARQGLKTACLAKIGNDSRGQSIRDRLKETGVSDELVVVDKKRLTGYSIILTAEGNRTVLVHRGSTEYLCREEGIPLKNLKQTKWFYISHLGGESSNIFSSLIQFASENGIKVALNPGSTQLKMGEKLYPYLDKVDVLILNQEEASNLTGISYDKEEEIFAKLDNTVRGFLIMTKGSDGFTACDNKSTYRAGVLKEPKYVDRTGAGDAFGSGTVSAIIKEQSLDTALETGSANATGVLAEWGANEGLLSADDDIYKFGKLNIEKANCKYD